MTSKPVALLMSHLGTTKTHSRPHVSNDNPYSEAQFKTTKYRPDFPKTFNNIEHARSFLGGCRAIYNDEHHHSGLEMHTPADVHFGRAAQRTQDSRCSTRLKAFESRPERFPHGRPLAKLPPSAVWINKPELQAAPTSLPTTH